MVAGVGVGEGRKKIPKENENVMSLEGPIFHLSLLWSRRGGRGGGCADASVDGVIRSVKQWSEHFFRIFSIAALVLVFKKQKVKKFD